MGKSAPKEDSAHEGANPPAKVKQVEDYSYSDLEAAGISVDSQAIDLANRKNVTLAAGEWYHAAWHITTTICTPAAYAPLAAAFAALTWAPGVIFLAIGWGVSLYNTFLLTNMLEYGGKKSVRYAQLGEAVYGPAGYWTVTFFQQVASIGNNIAVEIAAGLAMQSIYNIYQPNGSMTTQHFIVIFAAFQLLLSQLPDIHSLKHFNNFATLCTIGFAVTCLGLCIDNGHRIDDRADNVSYSVWVTPDTTPADVVFSFFSALGTVAFSFGDTILPEIQATIKEPQARNTQKGLMLSYGIIGGTYFIVAVAGYWAFGNAALPYLPTNFFFPNWGLVLVNLFAVIQIAGCFQIYCRPTYEWADLKIQNVSEGPYSLRNVICRFIVTLIYSCLMTLVACAIPFFGDFVALVGAIGFVPLDYIIPLILYNKVKNPHWGIKTLHWLVASIFVVVATLGFTGATRWINQHIHTYSFFANVGGVPDSGTDYSAPDAPMFLPPFAPPMM